MFGQPASSQTVVRPFSRTMPLSSSNREPGLAARTRIQSGRVLASAPQGTLGLAQLVEDAIGVGEARHALAVRQLVDVVEERRIALGEIREGGVKIVDDDPGESPRVDEKLVMLAKRWQCPIVTNDYNLNKVASLQGVPVMNINELANAVKSVLIPGEMLDIEIIQEGKEAGQGVGYLDDGTMVVVEEGRSYLNHTIPVTVTKVLQTAAGRLIFAKL